MTIRTLVSRLRGMSKEVSRDSYLPNRLLWNMLQTAGLLLVKRDRRFYSSNVFTTEVRDTEEVNIYEDTCVPLECISCRLKVEDILEDSLGIIYQYISTPDNSKTFKIVTPKQFVIKSKKTKGKELYAYYENGYIYFSKCYPCLKLSYLKDVTSESSNSSCSILDEEVFIPDYLLDAAIKMSMQDLGIFLQKQHDHTTNKNTTT